MDMKTRDLIVSIIDEVDDMTIAAVRQDGFAQATTVSNVKEGLTIFWPVVSLAAVYAAMDAEGWMLTETTDYLIVLPVIAVWGAWGLLVLWREE